ncbi:MAG TPA: permease-like cell division protein FtsX [Oscillospiraceae bacterium]|nr:permease-like cell division protein FtsX [Oscillospiraceae bacterium]HPS34617.1 permease-like cell division protein FtsX [Oscillospiraceae bacterium]
MKNKSIGYLLRQGFKNIFSNGLMSFASVSVLFACLLLVGGAFLMYFNIQKGVEYVGSMGEIVLFVEDGADANECSNIQKTLESLPELHDVQFISSTEGLAQLQSEITGGEQLFSMLEGQDILPNSFRVKVKDPNDYERMVKQLSQIFGISDVVANGKIANTLTNISTAIATFGAAVVVVLLVVSVFILINTIKLAMFTRRKEIYIMKMVGATNSFVRLPFFVEAVVLGLFSAIIAYVALRFAYIGLHNYLSELSITPIPWPKVSLTVLGSFLGAGFLVGMLSSSVSIKKYLKA